MKVRNSFTLASTLVVSALLLSSCIDPFEVNVNTPQPIKVDLTMDVNVYQHGTATEKEGAEAAADFRAAMDRRRDRMTEIQELKNNRLVGENRSGALSIKNRPAGEYGDYVEKTVEAENLDRTPHAPRSRGKESHGRKSPRRAMAPLAAEVLPRRMDRGRGRGRDDLPLGAEAGGDGVKRRER